MEKLLSVLIVTLIATLFIVHNAGVVYGVGEEGLHVKDGGNVGIGTTAPNFQLTIGDGTGSEIVEINSGGIASDGHIRFHQAGVFQWIIGQPNNIQDDAFSILNNSGAEKVTILQNGNVGIGTMSPVGALEVTANSGGGAPNIRYSNYVNDTEASNLQFTKSRNTAIGSHTIVQNGDQLGKINFYSSDGDSFESSAYIMAYADGTPGSDDTPGKLSFGTTPDGSGGSLERMTITAEGYVGIGTSAPAQPLVVTTEEYEKWAGQFSSTHPSAAHGLYVQVANTNSGYQALGVDTGGVRRFTVKNNGYVGIGTQTPSYILHVNGTAYATGAAGALSDLRHKKNVQPVSDGALNIIDSLRPVTYEWKDPVDSGMEGTQIGFIAQEVEGVLPGVVMTQDDEDKTKALKYNEFVPLIVKAIQEVKRENETLRFENEQLRNALASITDRQAALEDMFIAISTALPEDKLAQLGNVSH
ncbi:MAG: tail fiber domain-containing protein [Candidatus Brocadiaceae bacterium]|nr:tail fiber domain-containing protein [Candidatus Brocadiaceae bacterium]